MIEPGTFDVEVYEGRRWILLGGYPTANQAIAVARREGGTTRRTRVRADRWDDTRQLYVGKVIFEHLPGNPDSYKTRYLRE